MAWQDYLGQIGGVGGTVAGGAIGGPVGAAIGGSLGGLGGSLLGDYLSPSPDSSGQDEMRRSLEAAAYGRAPSAADLQMRQAQDAAGAQAYSLARSIPGLSPAAAARMGIQGSTDAQAQIAAQGAARRAQEQERARAALVAYYQQQYQNQQAQRDRQLKMFGSAMGGVGAAGAMFTGSGGAGAAGAAGSSATDMPAAYGAYGQLGNLRDGSVPNQTYSPYTAGPGAIPGNWA